ncbi:MAG TPA: hypothetical protein VGM82_07980 [Gemmatimonadaceae bacterium]
MRNLFFRLAVVAGSVAIVASCDSRLTTSPVSVGSSGSSTNTGVKGPTIAIDTPAVGSLVNVGDSLLVVVRLHDDRALTTATIRGLKIVGSGDLGTRVETDRYTALTIPATGTFRNGLKDTVIRRYLKPVVPVDSALDSLIVRVVAADSGGAVDTVTRRTDLVSGPKVTIVSPVSGDSAPAGIGLSVTALAEHPDGVGRTSIRFQGESTWPTKLDTTITTTVTGSPRSYNFTNVAIIPADAPLRGKITITANAVSVNGRPGNAPTILIFVRSARNAQPLVNQTVSPRLETTDSVTITARGDGIRSIGYVARDGSGSVILRDSVLLSTPFAGNASAAVSLAKLAPNLRGSRVAITGFAVDQSNRTGYAVRPGELTPGAALLGSFVDSTLLVFGHTFPLPSARSTGLIGDIAWDAAHENVVLSNQLFNRLEVFSTGTNSYDATGIAVGAFPWGLFVSNDPNVMWVANSGGDNPSRVDLTTHKELDAQRIRTRLTPLYTLTEDATVADANNPSIFHDVISAPIIYSDRPQYVAQLRDGTVFYSTRPTSTNTKGTIRYLNPSQPFPDEKAIVIYKQGASPKQHAVVNADSAFVISGAPGSDFVVLCDHDAGTNTVGVCAISNNGYLAAYAALKARVPTTDVSFVDGVDIDDAGLTDTTYVAASGDRNWVAFGAGHTAGAGNIFMASTSGFMSPPISQTDLTNNASDHVNGLALDSTGLTVAAHGDESFFASVDVPFHLRLQGKYTNLSPGQGITFHPQAKAGAGDVQRTGYIASNNQSIEVVDIFHYINRGNLPIKTNLYGPLRAALPGPADAANGVVLKLFGVSASGLVIIDLRAQDIQTLP